MITLRYDTSNLHSALAEIEKASDRAVSESSQQGARIYSLLCMERSAPSGSGDNAKKAGEGAVARDIRSLYIPYSYVYRDIKARKSEPLAKAFAAAVKRKNAAEIIRILRVAGLAYKVGDFDGGRLHRASRGANGRVPKRAASALVVPDAKSLREYEKQIQQRVGTAKAAHAEAARQVGDASPRALWIQRNMAPSLASVTKQDDGNAVSYSININVPYADRVLDVSDQQAAIAKAEKHMQQSAESILQAVSNKINNA